MTAYTMAQTLTNLRHALRRYALWLSVSLVLVMAAFAVYRAVSMPVVGIPATSSTAQAMPANPAQQAVLDYLRAHSSDQPIQAPTATFAPAQQSVMNYLHAHERLDQPAPFWNQAVQAVRDYLRAHAR
jgi:putative exporter of polyketide antibiotics